MMRGIDGIMGWIHCILVVVDQSLIETIIKAGAMADFFLHGVRHLAETKMAELKVPCHIRDRLFDHADDRGSGAT
jgi:hypothetical protein